MINTFIRKVKLAFSDSEIRNRVLFLIGALALFRFLSVIPVPGVDKGALAAFFANNQFFGLLNIFSGGGLARLSIVMLGVSPYITSSIVMQLATIVFPQVKQAYFEDGEAGRAEVIKGGRPLPLPTPPFLGVRVFFFFSI